MIKPFKALIVFCILFLSQVYAQDIETLKARHAEIVNKLKAYEKELDSIKSPGTSLTTYKALATKTWELKAELEQLDKEIGVLAQNSQTPQNLTAHQISVHLNDYDGELLTRPIANGEIVAFKAKIQTLGSEEAPQIGNLVWQLYDSVGQAVSGVQKASQISEKGQVEETRFRIKAQNLKNGQYTVALVHELANDAGKRSVAQATFVLDQPMTIHRVVVSNNTTAEKHQASLMSGEAPHGFVYFTLGASVPKVNVVMKMIEKGSGKVLAEQVVDRDREASGNEQRVGIRLDPSLVNMNETIEFIATLTSAEGLKMEESEKFSVKPYRLSLDTPTSITSGDRKKFKVNVPSNFKAPYQITKKVNQNLNVSIDENLNGLISGTTGNNQSSSRFKITVRDAEGREAYGSGQILIQPKVDEVKVAKSVEKTKENPKQTAHISKEESKPDQDPFKEMTKALEEIKKNNEEMAEKQKAQKIQQENDERMANIELGKKLYNRYFKEAYNEVTIPCFRYNYPIDLDTVPKPDEARYIALAKKGELNAKTTIMREWFFAYDQAAYTLKYDSCNDKFAKHLAHIGTAYRWSSIPTAQMLYQNYISKIKQNGHSEETVAQQQPKSQAQEKDSRVECFCYDQGYDKSVGETEIGVQISDFESVVHQECRKNGSDPDRSAELKAWFQGRIDRVKKKGKYDGIKFECIPIIKDL